MLTYPRFAKACYAFFAVAVVAAVLKLSISGAEPALLKTLPANPTASTAGPAPPPERLEDPRLGSFSDDGEAARLEATFSRAAARDDASEGSDGGSSGTSGDASIFRRPSMDRSSSEPVCGNLGDVPKSSRVVFPLPEAYFDSYDDTWGAARPQGGHEGSDLMSPVGTPEFAVTDGRLVEVAGSNENGWNRLGGYTVMLEAAYSVGPIKKGDLFYYAHMDRQSSLPVGTEVRAGQKIGVVGDTGEGPEVTRGKFPPHLHLGWYDAELSKDRSEAESGAMNPYPLLLWLERNGGAVSGGTDASYCQAPQSPNSTPSTGEPDWPTPSSPSQRPDLDTGSEETASPAALNDKPRKDRPRREGNKNGDAKKEGKSAGRAEAEEPAKAQEKAKKLSLRKRIEAKVDELLHNLPNLEPDRPSPGDGKEGKQDGRAKGDGRKDDKSGKGGEEGRQEKDRPEGNGTAPPNKPPKPQALPKPTPAPQPRPAPEAAGEGSEPPAPPRNEDEKPATPALPTTPAPTPPSSSAASEPAAADAATSQPVTDAATPADATGPVPDEAPLAAEEDEPAAGPVEGE